jgi:signal transduction histidine kinase
MIQRGEKLGINKTRGLLGLALILAISILATGLSGCNGTVKANSGSVSLEERNNQIASTAVHVAAIGLGQTLKDVTDEAQRVKIVQEFIDPIRFFNDKSGYFYVYYYNCVNVAHAIDKTLPGKDLTEYKDSKGLLVIQELSKKARSGGGYVTFWWPHPVTKTEQKKIGYVEPIPGADYFIGAGYYPDTR